jgi:lysophospholipase L1-like esterase
MRTPGLKPSLLVGALLPLLPLAGAFVLQAAKVARSLHRGRGIVSATSAFGQRPAQPRLRVLLLGDSTGLGVGAQAGQCIAALLAADHPDAEVLNLSCSGARLADVASQLQHLPDLNQRWDLLLLHAGGNDILRGTTPTRMQRAAEDLLEQLVARARHVVWLGPPNIGRLPAFVPPFSWLLSQRSASSCALFKRCADRFGVRFVDFCDPVGEAFFAADPLRFIAADQIHPTGESYRHCYGLLKQRLCDLDLTPEQLIAAQDQGLNVANPLLAGACPPACEAGPPFAHAG